LCLEIFQDGKQYLQKFPSPNYFSMDIDASLFPSPVQAEENPPLKFSFEGEGGEYFSIVIVNWLLTVLTLGFYYPWAKARKLSYLYSSTELHGSRFTFHGTGNEMFKGFIKAILVFIILFGTMTFFRFMNAPILAILSFGLGLFLVYPVALHGSYKYRMSRTSWRGIRLGYRGDRSELFSIFTKGVLLTIVTLGLYRSWLYINIRNYMLSRIRFGSLTFRYNGHGSDYFILNLKGYILTILTLGIYFFWWQKELFDYYINNLSIESENRSIKLRSKASGGGFFKLFFVNMLLLVFTIGLASPWVLMRTMRFIFSNVEVKGNVNLDTIMQTEIEYTDATGEDLSDLLDFGFVI